MNVRRIKLAALAAISTSLLIVSAAAHNLARHDAEGVCRG